MFKTRDFLPVIATALIVLALVIVGMVQSDACHDEGLACWLVRPFTIVFGPYDPKLNSRLLDLAQVGGRLVLLVGAFFASVRVWVSAVRHDVRTALARRMKNHTIVCGLGRTGMQIVRNLQSTGGIVVVDRVDNTTNIAASDQQGIPIIKGDASDIHVLTLAGLARAQRIVICTGEDASNIDIALRVKDWARNHRPPSPEPLVLLVEMHDQWLFSQLIGHDQQALGSSGVELRLFNTTENAARLLVRSLRLPPGPEVDAGTFIIAGFGSMGQQLLLHLIRAATAAIGSKAKIVVLDRAAEQQRTQFLHSHPAVAELADVTFVEANIARDHQEVWATIETILRERPLLGVAICFSDDQAGLYAALTMRRRLDGLARIHVPVFLRLEQHGRLGQLAAVMEKARGPYERFQVFGGIEQLLSPEILIQGTLDTLAKAFHRHYRETRQSVEDHPPADVPWTMLAETYKTASRRQADNVPILLAQTGLRLASSSEPVLLNLSAEEIELLARLEHRRWAIERRLAGVSHGAARTAYPVQHDLLTDWENLAEGDRERNRVGIRNLPKILAKAGLEIRRERRIVAVGATLAAAEPKLESALADEAKDCSVIADIDEPQGRNIAERALELPDALLWLVSREYPPQVSGVRQDVWEGAAGWIAREQFRGPSSQT